MKLLKIGVLVVLLGAVGCGGGQKMVRSENANNNTVMTTMSGTHDSIVSIQASYLSTGCKMLKPPREEGGMKSMELECEGTRLVLIRPLEEPTTIAAACDKSVPVDRCEALLRKVVKAAS